MPSAVWQWESARRRALRSARAVLPPPTGLPSPLRQWEEEHLRGWRRWAGELPALTRRSARGALIAAAAFLLGMQVASGRNMVLAGMDLKDRLATAEQAVKASQGELELARLELTRLNAIIDNSAKYRIPADLSAAIYDIALSEGLDPDLAYRLVRVESGFVRTAVSPMGAVGLTQVMPSTAEELSPGIAYHELFERDTNLRLGFRYLRQLLEKYNGDLHLALTAYNRGPGTVDRVTQAGGDPYNGYARAVLGLP